ncbi:hypothetical protein LSH36_184g01007 [Paralvinella palmiformis]|uniref:C2H2-type domain-containing protein n=1 Tax=Paralvinella palmiformis TaxID=53620 RepID=A0AAD9JSE5_9ANNE|nr:hypothetical protein LSH36_184g01007 [Paralvinella palmiformis]
MWGGVQLEFYSTSAHEETAQEELDVSVSRAKLPYPCSVCGKGFSYRETRDRHRKAFHFGIYSFMCQFCGRGFYDNVALKGHLSQHTGERAYSCVVHLASPYTCRFCGKGFSYPETVQRHEKAAHLGVFPYLCQYCGKGFQNKDNLKGHMSMHTGGKPYKCAECGAEFRWRPTLDGHIRKMHKTNHGQKTV